MHLVNRRSKLEVVLKPSSVNFTEDSGGKAPNNSANFSTFSLPFNVSDQVTCSRSYSHYFVEFQVSVYA